LYYWILQNKKELIRKSSGSTFIEISKKEIEKIPFSKPTLKEQQKIAQVLTLADKEIELLKKELKALKKQKKGLMQRLLTGEVRANV
jgi:type I restriction enzyme S subunit